MAKTAARYTRCAVRFVHWVRDNGDDAESAHDFDGLLVEYLQYIYEQGFGKSEGVNALYGILNRAPWLKEHLPMAKRALKGWTKRQPSVAWPPVTWPVCVAIGVKMATNGQHSAGVACVLAFDCLLRISELLALRARDIVMAGDPRVGMRFEGMWLRLAKTKTGPNKSVRVRSPVVRQLVLLLARGKRGADLLFPYAVGTFRRHFKRACADLRVSSDVVVHSLRHGGATHLYTEEKMAVGDIAEHGRWASVESARHYLQACRAVLMAREAEVVVELGRVLASDLVRSFALAQKHI